MLILNSNSTERATAICLLIYHMGLDRENLSQEFANTKSADQHVHLRILISILLLAYCKISYLNLL